MEKVSQYIHSLFGKCIESKTVMNKLTIGIGNHKGKYSVVVSYPPIWNHQVDCCVKNLNIKFAIQHLALVYAHLLGNITAPTCKKSGIGVMSM